MPQYILDQYFEKGNGSLCNILCTQPRRISALGLSERVASERCEHVGDTVGYSIRMESKLGRNTKLVYCTTGVLLRRLESESDGDTYDSLSDVSHVVIDEIHERSLEIDFLLMVLRSLLRSRKAKNQPLFKLILMSATLNAELYRDYFKSDEVAPRLYIPGRTFPVKTLYLEDILKEVPYTPHGYEYARNIKPNFKIMPPESMTSDEQNKRLDEDLTPDEMAARYPGVHPGILQSIHTMAVDKIQMPLVEKILHYMVNKLTSNVAGQRQQNDILNDKGAGAILVFLPGTAEIQYLRDQLLLNSTIRNFTCNGDFIVPLHGMLESSEQLLVFKRPPKGMCKIVLATNVAETSITVDDVVYVIDTGKMKETRFDPEKGMASLEEW